MTKQLLKISPHSFVDVMTNSSSELFVCNTDKSVEQVKAVIERVMKGYWMMVGEPEQEIWGTIFEEPRVAIKKITQEHINTYHGFSMTRAERDAIKERAKAQLLKENPEASEKQILDVIWNSTLEEDEKRWDAQSRYAVEMGDSEGLLSYYVTYDEGDIMVYSASDNSVPYEVWIPLENALEGIRYHLG